MWSISCKSLINIKNNFCHSTINIPTNRLYIKRKRAPNLVSLSILHLPPTQHDHSFRLLHRHVCHAPSLLRHAPRLRLRPLVAHLLPWPVLRHKPFCCSLRRSTSFLPLHLHQQHLHNEPQVHPCWHSPKTHCSCHANHLGKVESKREFRMDHHSLLTFNSSKHSCHGHSFA